MPRKEYTTTFAEDLDGLPPVAHPVATVVAVTLAICKYVGAESLDDIATKVRDVDNDDLQRFRIRMAQIRLDDAQKDAFVSSEWAAKYVQVRAKANTTISICPECCTELDAPGATDDGRAPGKWLYGWFAHESGKPMKRCRVTPGCGGVPIRITPAARTTREGAPGPS